MAHFPSYSMISFTRLAGLVLTLMLGSSVISADTTTTPGVSSELAQHRAGLLSRLSCRLHFAIPESAEAPIPGRLEIRFDLRDASQPLPLDFRESPDRLHALQVNGADLPATLQQEHILLPANHLQPGTNRVVVEFTAGDSSLNRNPDYLFTLFVPDRARTAFPLFDQPDLKAAWELSLLVPQGWTAVANAPLATRTAIEGGELYEFAPSSPISSYLFAFAAGRFEAVTRDIGGRPATLYHRETDRDKLARNLDAIFDAHERSLDWLEAYTGIPLPFPKFDFVLIPAFPYGGMEHPGAIFYRADKLLLEASPPAKKLLERARLIAHETAHMWFGNLVTMRWFDDVWTKEVFANLMADKLMNPLFPAIDHDLAFLLKHHPLAYGVDRSAGANPIRQRLDNLEEAGQMYGNIIYHKSPVMMRQLELIMGEDAFRSGLREYLQRFAWGNATWPELVAILDKRSGLDLGDWSKVWVESAGRPTFGIETAAGAGTPGTLLAQSDPAGRGRIWPQQFAAAAPPYTAAAPVVSDRHRVPMAANTSAGSLLNADGGGYGLFPPRPELFEAWDQLPALIRGALLVDSYENLEEGRLGAPAHHLQRLIAILEVESDQLLLREALRHLKRVYLVLLEEAARSQFRDSIEETLWRGVTGSGDDSLKRLFYDGFTALASSPDALRRLHAIWEEQSPPPGLALEESDYIELAELLAIQLPARAKQIVAAQAARMVNPDARRRLAFIAPSLSPDPAARDAFFHSLAQPGNRETELWVINALARLHHPSRLTHSERYLQRTLELLEEIQRTGDIFFPSKWLEASLALHASPAAAGTVRAFIAARPGYNAQLRMKILQEADPLFRACRIRHGAAC